MDLGLGLARGSHLGLRLGLIRGVTRGGPIRGPILGVAHGPIRGLTHGIRSIIRPTPGIRLGLSMRLLQGWCRCLAVIHILHTATDIIHPVTLKSR